MCTCEFQKYVEFLNPSIIHSLACEEISQFYLQIEFL